MAGAEGGAEAVACADGADVLPRTAMSWSSSTLFLFGRSVADLVPNPATGPVARRDFSYL